jgi:HSP20 family molecular chaperone IbpA
MMVEVEARAPMSSDSPRGPSRLGLWLGGIALVLLGAVVTLAVVLATRDSAPAPGAPKKVSAAASQNPAHSTAVPDGGAPGATAARPYVNLLDPNAPPVVPPAPKANPPSPPAGGGALGGLLSGLGTLLDDPDLQKTVKDLRAQIQKGGRILGGLFGGRATPPSGGAAPADPLDDLMKQAVDAFKRFAGGGFFGGADDASDGRIAADVRDEKGAFVVRCRFPKGAPETASFQIKGDKLVVKARFRGVGDVEREVELPGPVHPMGARSDLRGGELIVTLPKAS